MDIVFLENLKHALEDEIRAVGRPEARSFEDPFQIMSALGTDRGLALMD